MASASHIGRGIRIVSTKQDVGIGVERTDFGQEEMGFVRKYPTAG